MRRIIEQLEHYVPCCEQEARDRQAMLAFLRRSPDALERSNLTAHLTASAWTVNAGRTQVLMAYHNIFRSWAWLGGHADGDPDLLAVALREVHEESGVTHVALVSRDIFSIEVLTVDGHIKHGQYVPSHLHLNVTYLLEADTGDTLTAKPDENSGVRWFPIGEAAAASNEPWFREHIYGKLNAKLRAAGK